MTVSWETSVVEVRLPADADELGRTTISEFQRRRVPASPTGLVDAGRVLVIGTCASICDAAASIERIAEAPSVRRVLCLLVDDVDGVVPPSLRLPSLLSHNRSISALWVGDERGVLWRLGTTKARALTVCPQDADAGLSLTSLLAALREPEVFDAVCDATAATGTVLSPALRVLVPGTAPMVLKAAERTAVRLLAGDESAPVAAMLRATDLQDEAFLLGNAPSPAELFDHRGATGRLARRVQDSIEAGQAQLHRVSSIRGGAVTAEALADVKAVGQALDDLYTFQRSQLFSEINGSDGLNPTEVGVLKAAGLRSAAITEATAIDIDKYRLRLRDLAVGALERTRSLAAVSGELRSVAALATPRSTEETVEALDACCPEELRSHLRDYPALSLRISSGWSLVLLWLLAASLALVPVPYLAIPLGLILTGALVLLSAASDATSKTMLSYVSTQRRELFPVVVALAVGALCGAVLQLRSPSTALTIAGVVLTPMACAAWLRVMWVQSATRWAKGARLDDAARALHELLELTATVATNDWILANPRLQLADSAGRLANVLEELRALLLKDMPDIVAGDQPDHDGRGFANPAVSVELADVQGRALMQRAGDARDIVMHDYVDLVAGAIDDRWFALMTSAEDSDTDVADDFLVRMEDYRHALYAAGLFATGDSSAASARRKRELLASVWRETDGVAQLLATSAASDLVQLCAAEHLPFLDEEPARALMVRFAPEAYRPESGEHALVQTRSLLLAGVIRLVPLRGGIADFGDDRVVGHPSSRASLSAA
jgi:hypothetical protein